jgi:hypothetical protein
MNSKQMLFILPLICAFAFSPIVFSVPSSDAQSKSKSLSRSQLLRRLNRMSKPANEHRFLQALVGVWNGSGTARARGDLKMEPVRCRLKSHWILGGRFLEQTIKFVSGGNKIEGRSFLGYDRVSRHYVGIWMDTTHTGYTSAVGHKKGTGRLVFQLTHNDVEKMKKVAKTSTITLLNDAQFSNTVTEVHEKTGKPIILFKMVYTR